MVKSMPGAQHGDVLDFLKEAEFVAFQGEALAHAVSDWVRKAKKQFHQDQVHASGQSREPCLEAACKSTCSPNSPENPRAPRHL
jgi:hypothetical protein